MRVRHKMYKLLAGTMAFLLAVAGMSFPAQAAGTGLLISGNPFSPVTYTYGEDGVVDGMKEFVIAAESGANYEIEITFTGTGGEGEVISFFYGNVNQDETVPNVLKDANDRSGLLNEPVKAGEEQVRTFVAAAIDGDIIIRGSGRGKVISIRSTRQMPKTAGEKVTVYTVGDSLVQTYSEKYVPQAGWGQTLPEYFGDNVNFVNKAIGGRSTGNFMRQGRLNDVLCSIAPGDYVLIEFGHNDANGGSADRYVSVENYKKFLTDIYIKAIRDRGATPVLVTVCNQNVYERDSNAFIASYPEYVAAMRQVAEETGAPLVDLNAITVKKFTELNEKWGKGITDIIYNKVLPGIYEGQYANGAGDGTHLQRYGAMVVAGYIAEALRDMNLAGLSEYYVPAEAATTVPGAPVNLAERVYDKTPCRVTWDAVPEADFYQVLMAKLVEVPGAEGTDPVYAVDGEFEVMGYTTTCEYSYRMAEKNAHYAYKIVAVNEAGVSPESEVFAFGLKLNMPEAEATAEPVTQATAQPDENSEEVVLNPMSVAWKVLGLFVLSVFAFVGLMVLISYVSNRKDSKNGKKK